MNAEDAACPECGARSWRYGPSLFCEYGHRWTSTTFAAETPDPISIVASLIKQAREDEREWWRMAAKIVVGKERTDDIEQIVASRRMPGQRAEG